MIKLKNLITESNIRNAAYALADDMERVGIFKGSYVSSTGSGAMGKYKVIGASGHKDQSIDGYRKAYNDFKRKIEKNYEATKYTTSLSSKIYYSKKHKVYFFFYYNSRDDRSYDPSIDDYHINDFIVVVLSTIPKSIKKSS
jgi:hypothetical protein